MPRTGGPGLGRAKRRSFVADSRQRVDAVDGVVAFVEAAEGVFGGAFLEAPDADARK